MNSERLITSAVRGLFIGLVLGYEGLRCASGMGTCLLYSFEGGLLSTFRSLHPVRIVRRYRRFFPVNRRVVGSLFGGSSISIGGREELTGTVSHLSNHRHRVLCLCCMGRLDRRRVSTVLNVGPRSDGGLLSHALTHLHRFFFSISAV